MASALYNGRHSPESSIDLWIGNIPYETSEKTLKQVLERYVPVVALKIIRDHQTQQSRGFGFVTLGYEHDAKELLGLRPGSIKIGRRSLKVKPAHKQKPKEPEPIRPGHMDYVLHQRSTEPYDLEPLVPELHCGHVLVDDVMLAIFQMFSPLELLRFERVCRRWQGLIYRIMGGNSTIDFRTSKSPWGVISCRYSWHRKQQLLCLQKALIMNTDSVTTILLDDVATYDYGKALNAIGQIAPNLEKLSIKCIEKTAPLSLKNVVGGCPNLRHVHLAGLFRGDSFVGDLENCKSLESFCVRDTSEIITLSTFEKLPDTLTEVCLEAASGSIVNNFPACIVRFSNLKKLRFVSAENYSPSCLHIFDVRHFDLDTLMTGKGIKLVTQEELDLLAEGCPLLENLQINVSSEGDQTPNFSKFPNLKSLRVFSSKFNLKTFFLSCLPPVTDLRIKFANTSQVEVVDVDFSQPPSSIQSLSFNRVPLSSKHFETLLLHPGLKNLYIKNCAISIETLKQLVSSLTLEELGVHLKSDVNVSELRSVQKTRDEACRKAVKSGASIATPPRLVLHVCIGFYDQDPAFLCSLNTEYLTVKGYDKPNFMRRGSLSISDSELSFGQSGSGIDDDDDDDDDDNYFDDLDYEDYLGDPDDDEEGLLQFIHPINLLDDENDKYLFGYGDPDYDGDYYLGHWD